MAVIVSPSHGAMAQRGVAAPVDAVGSVVEVEIALGQRPHVLLEVDHGHPLLGGRDLADHRVEAIHPVAVLFGERARPVPR